MRVTALMVGRLSRRPRLWILIGALLSIFGVLVFRARSGWGGQAAWWTVLRHTTIIPSMLVLPLLAAIASGTGLVEDRASGVIGLVMSRGLSRTKLVVAYFAAGWLVAAASIAGVIALIACFISLIGPATGSSELFPSIPVGFPQEGLGLAATFGMVIALSCGFWVAIECLVGVATKNLYATVCLPMLLNITLVLLIPGRSGFSAWGMSLAQRVGPGPGWVVGGWAVGTLTAIGAAVVLASRRQVLA